MADEGATGSAGSSTAKNASRSDGKRTLPSPAKAPFQGRGRDRVSWRKSNDDQDAHEVGDVGRAVASDITAHKGD